MEMKLDRQTYKRLEELQALTLNMEAKIKELSTLSGDLPLLKLRMDELLEKSNNMMKEINDIKTALEVQP